jgi:hypothetical protein
MDHHVSGSTVRVLAALLIVAFDVAREKASSIAARLKPLLQPPDDLRVVSRSGALYSGVLVLDRSDIVGGVVVQTGQSVPLAPALDVPRVAPRVDPIPPRPAASSFATRPDTTRLPSWADDPRGFEDEEEEVPTWRR